MARPRPTADARTSEAFRDVFDNYPRLMRRPRPGDTR